ncbi:hypothetical protein BDP27DRAFT_1475775, partial [Rhodocollybia butyracea]
MAKTIQELIEDAVNTNRARERRKHFIRDNWYNGQSAASFSHRESGADTETQLETASSTSQNITTVGSSGKASKKPASAQSSTAGPSQKAPTKTVSSQSSFNLPSLHYPPNSRLIPNTMGTKESATAARYRCDSNDLRLEGMIRTETAATREHIQNLRDSLRQHEDSHKSAHRDLVQDNLVTHEDVDDLQKRVHDLESTRGSYDFVYRRLDQLEQRIPDPSQPPLTYVRTSRAISPPPPLGPSASTDHLPSHSSDIFSDVDVSEMGPDPPRYQSTPPSRAASPSCFASPTASSSSIRSPTASFAPRMQMDANSSLFQRLGSTPPLNIGPTDSSSDLMATDQDYHMSPPMPPFVTPDSTLSPNSTPLVDRISQRPGTPSPIPERQPKRRKIGTSPSGSSITHYGIPGSV